MAEYKIDEAKLKEVCSVLKAVLTSFGGELPLDKIDNEFKTVVGVSIPYREFKHGSLASFLQSIPRVLNLVNKGKLLVVRVVNDENISLILQQVREQNNSKPNKNAQKNKRLATRQLHSTHGPQPLVNSHWHNTNWHRPTAPNSQRGAPHQDSRRTPARPHTPPYQSPRGVYKPPPLRVSTPPGFQKNPQQQQTTPRTVTLSTTGNESPRPKSPAPPKTPTTTPTTTITTPTTTTRKTFKQTLSDAVKKLETTTNDKLNPKFQSYKCGKKGEWCCVLFIGETRVSNYPDTTQTQEEAEEAASKKALSILPSLHRKRQATQQLPATTDYTESIRLVQQLLEQKGKKKFWFEAIQEMYLSKYSQRLPQDWLVKVRNMTNTGLTFDNPCMDKWTVGLADKTSAPQNNTKTNTTPATPTESPRTPSPCEENGRSESPSKPPQLPPIELPKTPTWDVFITCIEDNGTMQLMLVGEKFSDLYNDLVTEMELYYMEEKNQEAVKEPVVGEVYVAKHEESWFRVKLVDVSDDEVKVKFLDHGDTEDIPSANLCHLHHKFFCLPPQGLQCCLAGLEDAPEEAAFQALMETIPMGKTLVARVQRRQEPYAVVLFDTSTNEDVNLNEKVFDSLALNLVEPTLPQAGGLAEVYLTHVSTDGTLYVQIESKTYKILQDLLKIAKRRTEEMLGEKVVVDMTKLYMARFSEDGDWYRAAPRSSVDPDGMALPCRLHNVPNNPALRWTTQACERLTSVTSPDMPLLLKVVSEGGVSGSPPSVQLFKKLMPKNELVSVNDTLSMDDSLFSSEGDSNNNSVEKVFVVSKGTAEQQQEQQQQQSASASPSHPSNPPQVGPEDFPPCFPLSVTDIPELTDYFDVFVTFTANPNHFVVQPWKMSRKFDMLSESIQQYYQDPDNLKQVVSIQTGQYCAVRHSDDIWYRAKVEVVMDTSVAGIFVDFGDRFFTTLDKVQPLTPAFCTVPCLAIKADLYGIKAVNEDWSPEDACRFRELASNKNLVSIVGGKNVTNNTCTNLSLVLIDTSDKTVDMYINQTLVDEGRAVFVQR